MSFQSGRMLMFTGGAQAPLSRPRITAVVGECAYTPIKMFDSTYIGTMT